VHGVANDGRERNGSFQKNAGNGEMPDTLVEKEKPGWENLSNLFLEGVRGLCDHGTKRTPYT